jgi:hypothetical protein
VVSVTALDKPKSLNTTLKCGSSSTQHVVGLDVTVRDAAAVQEAETVEDLPEGGHAHGYIADTGLHYLATLEVGYDNHDVGSFAHLSHLHNVGLRAVVVSIRAWMR